MTQAPPTEATRPARNLNDLGIRAASAVVMIVIAIGSTKLGETIFALVWLLAAIAVFWEWQTFVAKDMSRGAFWLGVAALVVIAVLARDDIGDAFLALIVAILAQAVLAYRDGARLWATVGQLYAGFFILALVALHSSFPYGSRAIVWLFAVVWATDVFAYFGGRLIGGPKLWPRVSPSKTWSGTLVGITAGGLIGTFCAIRDLPPPSAMVPIFVLSLAAAILSQGGDMFESSLKRHFGVKDSSRLIPGHGGFMDRLDGFIAAALFAFALGYLRNLPSIASGLFYWA